MKLSYNLYTKYFNQENVFESAEKAVILLTQFTNRDYCSEIFTEVRACTSNYNLRKSPEGITRPCPSSKVV